MSLYWLDGRELPDTEILPTFYYSICPERERTVDSLWSSLLKPIASIQSATAAADYHAWSISASHYVDAAIQLIRAEALYAWADGTTFESPIALFAWLDNITDVWMNTPTRDLYLLARERYVKSLPTLSVSPPLLSHMYVHHTGDGEPPVMSPKPVGVSSPAIAFIAPSQHVTPTVRETPSSSSSSTSSSSAPCPPALEARSPPKQAVLEKEPTSVTKPITPIPIPSVLGSPPKSRGPSSSPTAPSPPSTVPTSNAEVPSPPRKRTRRSRRRPKQASVTSSGPPLSDAPPPSPPPTQSRLPSYADIVGRKMLHHSLPHGFSIIIVPPAQRSRAHPTSTP
ncbi:hypothetical protein DL93DRAFT_2092369 [Clavulina sp. PMI_390]|nr:hypothetical protein DL93DRAFT_2092369 [Clavulina sp. PMI_390]